MKIVWLERGAKSLYDHIDYIARDNPQAAGKTIEIIEKAVNGLAGFTYAGRIGRIANTRELVVASYVIPYRVKKDRIEILHILHSAQNWPKSL